MIPHFYCHPGILNYTFGPNHPLKPERVRRTLALLTELYEAPIIVDTIGQVEDLLLVHAAAYVETVQLLSNGARPLSASRFGFTSGDNPPFAGMFEAALGYVGSSAAAARAVRDGAPLAFGIGGGLHHARKDLASGFCVFNDCAVACAILRQRFQRVAYVDIDVHHGDGVQWIFYDDPSVLTASIHQDGRTIYPGTGFTDETGADFSALNLPVPPRTTGDVWLDGFEQGILAGVERWQPDALVLQLGTDTHFQDQLGQLASTQGHWLAAVKRLRDLNLPTVALGGGGYNLNTVPRMWVSAILTLAGLPFTDDIPARLAEEWEMPTFSDPIGSVGEGQGRNQVEQQLALLRRGHALLAKNAI